MDKLPGRRVVIALAALAAVGLLAGYGAAMRAKPRSASIPLSSPSRGAPDGAAPKTVYVHVGGAVARSGLFKLPLGARVDDALRAAGGPAEGADVDALNLAAKVKDGDKVLVPKRAAPGAQPAGEGEAPPGEAGAAAASGRVNINSATLADLETLPGIGPALAERIIDVRTERGGFRRIEDLLDVPGIGPKKFEALKDDVTV